MMQEVYLGHEMSIRRKAQKQASVVEFTEVWRLVDDIEHLSLKDIQTKRAEILENKLNVLWFENRIQLRKFKEKGKINLKRIEEYSAREQILRSIREHFNEKLNEINN